MDLLIVGVILFYGTVEAKEFLRTGQDIIVGLAEKKKYSEKDPSDVLALLIMEHDRNLEGTYKSNTYKEPKTLPWIDSLKPNKDMDSSGDSNSDEYPDTDTEIDTESDSNDQHDDDYVEDTIKQMGLTDFVIENSEVLRNRWRSCQKKAAEVCREACDVSYKNACDAYKCRRKLKKVMKKECKRNCKEFFM